MSGTLYLCATPIGNLGDMSQRLIETLKSVDLIAAEDTRHTLKLLNHLQIKKPMISYYEHNRREKGEQLVKRLLMGESIALVSDAGTPAISDPGEDLVALCAKADIPVIPVPGPVAAICALIVSALPTGRFAFEGFLSMNRKSRMDRLDEVKNDKRTLIFYEAPHKLRNTLKDMYEVFGDRKISLSREITKLHEETIRTTLSEAQNLYSDENPPKGEYVLVIAPADKTDEEMLFESMTVSEHVDFYIKGGDDEKTAMKKVAAARKIPKRDVYSEYKLK